MRGLVSCFCIKKSSALWLSLATAAVWLSGAFWQWVIMEWITQFLFPLVELAGVALLAVSGVLSLLRLVRTRRREPVLDFWPLAINLVTIALLVSVPFTSLWLDANYRWNRAARTLVVQQVNAGLLKPNVSYNPHLIELPDASPTLSLGGNEIVVRDSGNGSYVLFFTFRGVLDHYSGFLYIPPGGSPNAFAELCGDHFVEVEPLESQWFFVASV